MKVISTLAKLTICSDGFESTNFHSFHIITVLMAYLIIAQQCVVGLIVGVWPSVPTVSSESSQERTSFVEIETLSEKGSSFGEYPFPNANITLLTNNITQNKVMASLSNTSVSLLLDKLLSEDVYDKRIRPGFGGNPLTIYTDIEIRSFGPISENEMMWIDPRLKFHNETEQKSEVLLVLSMDWKFLQKVWTPDTSIFNGRNSYMHKVTVPNKFIRVRQDGQLRYSMRLTIKASCPMHLRKYPFDMQSCGLQIGSFAYTSKDIVYRWKGRNPVVISDDVTLSQYNFVNITTANMTKLVSNREERSSIMVRFILQRRRGYFILQIYAPCALIVGASWVSFWINRSDAAGRVSVGATTVLTLVTMGFGGRASLPRVTYATALDWFIVMCFAFVFTAMVEYACVNFVDHKQAEQIQQIFKEKIREHKSKNKIREKKSIENEEQEKDCREEGIQEISTIGDDREAIILSETEVNLEFVIEDNITDDKQIEIKGQKSKKSNNLKDMPIEQLATLQPTGGERVDEWARFAFPVTFAFLNLIYWILFLYTIDDELDIDFDNNSLT